MPFSIVKWKKRECFHFSLDRRQNNADSGHVSNAEMTFPSLNVAKSSILTSQSNNKDFKHQKPP